MRPFFKGEIIALLFISLLTSARRVEAEVEEGPPPKQTLELTTSIDAPFQKAFDSAVDLITKTQELADTASGLTDPSLAAIQTHLSDQASSAVAKFKSGDLTPILPSSQLLQLADGKDISVGPITVKASSQDAFQLAQKSVRGLYELAASSKDGATQMHIHDFLTAIQKKQSEFIPMGIDVGGEPKRLDDLRKSKSWLEYGAALEKAPKGIVPEHERLKAALGAYEDMVDLCAEGKCPTSEGRWAAWGAMAGSGLIDPGFDERRKFMGQFAADVSRKQAALPKSTPAPTPTPNVPAPEPKAPTTPQGGHGDSAILTEAEMLSKLREGGGTPILGPVQPKDGPPVVGVAQYIQGRPDFIPAKEVTFGSDGKPLRMVCRNGKCDVELTRQPSGAWKTQVTTKESPKVTSYGYTLGGSTSQGTFVPVGKQYYSLVQTPSDRERGHPSLLGGMRGGPQPIYDKGRWYYYNVLDGSYYTID